MNTVAEAAADEQYRARGAIVTAEHPEQGAFEQTAPIWAGTPAPEVPVPIRDGEVSDTAELLVAAGLAPEAVAELTDEGVIA